MVSLQFLLGFTILFSAVLAVEDPLLPSSLRMSKVCGAQCKFRFCKINEDNSFSPKGKRVNLRDPGIAIPPFICRPRQEIGRILETGEAIVGLKGSSVMVPVSNYSPSGLSPPFASDYFGIYGIFFPTLPGKQGVGRGANRGNQDDFAGDLCVKIPIKKYEVVRRGRKRVVTVSPRKQSKECISFTTNTPLLVAELTWLTGANFDIEVTEPDGNVIRKNQPSATGGSVINDNNNPGCGVLKAGSEQIRWAKGTNPKRGKYTVTIIQRRNCGTSSLFGIFVISEGRLLAGTTRTASKKRGVVHKIDFVY